MVPQRLETVTTMATAPEIDVSALTLEEQYELIQRLEAREKYKTVSEEERKHIHECARLEADFATFVKEAWHIIRPGMRLDWSWHYDLIAEYLTMVYDRKITRLIINISPRTLKSLLVSVMWPVWVWTKQPNHGFLSASYAQDLSTEHSILRRDLIESDWFRARWGKKIWLASDQNQKTKFKNNHQAQMIATSVGAKATGLGGNTLIMDDALNPKQAASEAERKTAHDWFDNTWRSRMNNQAEDALIVLEQRTGEMDLTGHLLDADKVLVKQGHKKEWIHLSIPLECDEESGVLMYVFPISKRKVTREIGDVLQPKRFPPEVVASLKIRRLVWSSQYQQRPSPLEGNLIKRSEVRYFGGLDPLTGELDRVLPVKFDFIAISADCTFKDEAKSDYVAIGTIGVFGPDRFLLEVTNKHLDEPATKHEILRQKNKWGATIVWVEDKANGSAVIKSLKQKISGVKAIEPEGGKFARMFVAAGNWQSGNWYVDRMGGMTEEFIEQITKFPGAKHDDMADMMSQADIQIEKRVVHFGLTDFYKAEQAKLEAEMSKKKQLQNGQRKVGTGITTAEQTKPINPLKPDSPEQPADLEPTSEVIAKIVVPDNAMHCPNCDSTAIGRLGREYRCQNCGSQFGAEKPAGAQATLNRGRVLHKG